MLFGSKIHALTPIAAHDGAKAGTLTLVDVRQPQERRSGVAPGALCIPLGELSSRIGELPTSGTVAFVCRSGHRSQVAARQARKQGIAVATVDGGMLAWTDASLPMTEPAPTRNRPQEHAR